LKHQVVTNDDDDDADRTRADAGQFGSEFDDEQFVAAVEELASPTSGDVARSVGCSRATARRRLKQLKNERRVESQEVGGYRVWSVQ